MDAINLAVIAKLKMKIFNSRRIEHNRRENKVNHKLCRTWAISFSAGFLAEVAEASAEHVAPFARDMHKLLSSVLCAPQEDYDVYSNSAFGISVLLQATPATFQGFLPYLHAPMSSLCRSSVHLVRGGQ